MNIIHKFALRGVKNIPLKQRKALIKEGSRGRFSFPDRVAKVFK